MGAIDNPHIARQMMVFPFKVIAAGIDLASRGSQVA
jgi:hypothetical protein